MVSLDEKAKNTICDKVLEDDGLVHIWGDGEHERPEPISREEFKQELALSSIVIMYEDELNADFVYPVDGIFTDHQFDVMVDEKLNVTDCGMNG